MTTVTRRPKTADSVSSSTKIYGVRDVSKTLTAERRDKLLALQRREQMKDVLIDKFKKNNTNCSEKMISKEVNHFVNNAKVTKANLNRLERRIRHKATDGKHDGEDDDDDYHADGEEKGIDAATSVPEDVVSCYSAPSMAPSKLTHTTSLSALLSAGKVPNDYAWGRLDDYAMFLHERDKLRAKNCEKNMQYQLKEMLDKQVADREVKKKKLEEDEKRYYDNLLIELEEWKHAEKAKSDAFTYKMLEEKKGRDAQMELNLAKKEKDRQEAMIEEECQMKQVEIEIAAEKKATEIKKAEAKKAILEVFKENMREKAIKEAESTLQVEKELQEQRNLIRLQEEAAKEKQDESEERDKRQKALVEKMKSEVTTAAAEAGREDAIRAQAQRDEADSRAALIQMTKNQKLAEIREDTKKYLFKQMDAKKVKKESELKLKDLQASVLRADADEYNQAEEEKVIARRLRNLENRAQLEQQIFDKHSRTHKAMSSSEISMNIDLINVVEKTLKERDAVMKEQQELEKRRKELADKELE